MSDKDFLVEANIQDVLKFLIEDKGLSIADAMRQFYTSDTFDKLQNCETGLYLESPAYIYDLYLSEIKNSGIVQDEI